MKQTSGTQAISANRKKIEGLDGLRGLAAIMVLAFHGIYSAMHPLFQAEKLNWTGASVWIAEMTHVFSGGTTLFFVLSGFLISRTLVSGRPLGWDKARDFYFRRLARIYPLYGALLFVLMLLGLNYGYLLLSSIFLANVTDSFHVQAQWLPIWSLSVDTHFYLAWPLLLIFLGERSVAALCLAIIVASPFARAWGFSHHANIHQYTWYQMDALASGSLLAIAIKQGLFNWLSPSRLAALLVGACVLLVALAPSLLDRHSFTGAICFYDVFMLLGLAAIAGAMSGHVTFSWLNFSWLKKLGLWSYGIYVFHPLLFSMLRSFEKLGWLEPVHSGEILYVLARASGVGVVSITLAWLSSSYFENPVYEALMRKYQLRKAEPQKTQPTSEAISA